MQVTKRKFSVPEMQEKVYWTLTFKPPYLNELAEQVWNQEYSDVIRRIEMLWLYGNPDHQVDTYAHTNKFGKRLALRVIDGLEAYHRNLQPQDWYRLSVAAGLVGLQEKTSFAATSGINPSSVVAWDRAEPDHENVERILKELLEIISRTHVIDDSDLYFNEVLKDKSKLKVVSFPDDYIETIFLLKFYEKQLLYNPNLEIYCVPKSVRCGNDATWRDIEQLLRAPLFKELAEIMSKQGRFKLVREGPKTGGLNFNKLSERVIKIVQESHCLDVRGARAYEMAQGVLKPVYFSFAVSREMSESVTGLDAESKHLVILRQNAGEKSFRGFRQRHTRRKRAPSGREYMVAPYAAIDYIRERQVR